MLGDINNDGLLNIQDIVLLINFILNNSEPDDNQFIIADMNSDGILNILDVVLMVELITN